MDVIVRGSAVEIVAASVRSLAIFGDIVSIEASPSELIFKTENMSGFAQSFSFKPDFFAEYNIVGKLRFTMVLEDLYDVSRIPPSDIVSLRIRLTNVDAAKLSWTVKFVNDFQDTKWIDCTVLPDNVEDIDLTELVDLISDFRSLLGWVASFVSNVRKEITEKGVYVDDQTKGKLSVFFSYVQSLSAQPCSKSMNATE
ncbi:hypothetical protein RND81_13G004700 [Saponaria officinalis]|uniref:Uncharacterized protein n=1 Tax=Saponaria officinalis TaxID=3572 RepID=A0AAW1GUM3_SAPOF